MEKIKYYDAIKGEEIEVEVTEEVAEAMRECDRNERRIKRNSGKHEVSVDGTPNGQALLIDNSDNPEEILIRKEEKEGKYRKRERRKLLVRKAIKTLTAKEKEVIRKVFWGDYTQAELARELGISRNAVNKRYENALNKIKEFVLNNE